jgi:hypothetical protein
MPQSSLIGGGFLYVKVSKSEYLNLIRGSKSNFGVDWSNKSKLSLSVDEIGAAKQL